VTFDDAAFADLDLNPRLLGRIGVLDGDGGKFLRQLADLRARLLGAVQALGGGADVFLGKGHDKPAKRDVRRDD
jgi:hypothetical protein